MIDFLFI